MSRRIVTPDNILKALELRGYINEVTREELLSVLVGDFRLAMSTAYNKIRELELRGLITEISPGIYRIKSGKTPGGG